MRFTPDSSSGNFIRSYTPGRIELRNRVVETHAIISHNDIITDWSPPPLSDLTFDDFSRALELQPDVILFGTGARQQFPALTLLTEIMQAGVAIEVMQTDAACRTFNVLIGENRAAVAVLLVD